MTHPLLDHNSPQQSVSLIVRKIDVYPYELTLVQRDISLNKFVSTKLNKFDFVTDNQYHQLNRCHGLMCFWRYDSNEDKDLFFLSNPLTAEWVKLFDAEPLSKDIILYHGFGYSPSTNPYKAVRIGGAGFESTLHITVYTIGSSSGWRRIKGDTMFQRFLFNQYFWSRRSTSRHLSSLPVEFDGFFHWLYNHDSDRVICFDLGAEKFGTFPIPGFPNRICFDLGAEKLGPLSIPSVLYQFIPQIGVLNGRLTMCVHTSREVMQIWALEYYYTIRGPRVKLGKKLGDFYRGSSDLVKEEIVDFDEIENKCLMVQDFCHLSYCFEAETKRFQHLNKVWDIDEKSALHSFVPGFLSPKHMMSLAR